MSADTPAKAESRHEMFLADAVRRQKVWGLSQGKGWANWSTDDGDKVLPLWSNRSEAKRCASLLFPGYTPQSLGLKTLVDDMLPKLSEQRIWVGTNLTSEMTGIELPADELAQKLKQAGLA